MENSYSIATILIVLITSVTSFFAFNNVQLFQKMKFEVGAILRRNEYIRIFSSGLLHVNLTHLIFNMFSFYSFSYNIERIYGSAVVVFIYCIALFGGSLLALFIQRKNPGYSAVGASGAVSGIIMASVFLLPGGSVYLFFIPIPIPAYIYAVLFILISMYGIHSQSDSIGHEAHLGGAILGLVTTAILYPQAVSHNPVLFGVIMAIVVVFFIYIAVKPSGLEMRRR